MPNLKPSRLPDRASYDDIFAKEILDEALYCTVSYTADNQTVSIPTGYTLMGDRVYVHGSVKSNFLVSMPRDAYVCVSLFLFDGLVLAKSAFHHSVNYRSLIFYSKPIEVTDEEEKVAALKSFTEKYLPGRWEHLRPIKPGEIQATTVISFDLEQASCKERQGAPTPEPLDKDHVLWTGVIPAYQGWGIPMLAPDISALTPYPEHLERYKPRSS